MALIKPKKLKPGGTIGIVAPSSYCPPEDLANIQPALESLGFNTFLHPQCHARDHMSAGTVAEKIAALHDVFADPAIDAISCLRGGYQAINMLDKIDYDLIRRHPKIIVGYSDITVINCAITRQAGLVTFHGPTTREKSGLVDETRLVENRNSQRALSWLSGDIPDNLMQDSAVKVIKSGNASGILWGGNVQLVSALIEAGEMYHPPFKNAILIIEDIAEEITKFDRQFSAWRLGGVFDKLAGFVIGYMTDVRDTPGRAGAFGYDLEHVIREHTRDMKGPVIMNAPFGHEYPNYVFPIGVKARLTAETGGAAQLQLLESPFADA